VDGSAEFVAHVRARLERAGLSHRVRVECADLNSMTFRAGTFDGAVSGEVLEHLAEDRRAVRAIAEALRPGGVFALSVPADPDRFDWLDQWAGHERRYDGSEVRSLLEDAGLNVDVLVRWGFPFLTLYERFVQRPGLATTAPIGEGHLVARIARSEPVRAGFAALFALDRCFEGRLDAGTGFLARGRRP
jgi:SAM-dependent methyltransferase